MSIITKGQLKWAIMEMNRATNSPVEPYTTQNGKTVANVGNYHLEEAYGGYNVTRTIGQGDEIHHPFGDDFMPKRELLGRIRAFLAGIKAGRAAPASA